MNLTDIPGIAWSRNGHIVTTSDPVALARLHEELTNLGAVFNAVPLVDWVIYRFFYRMPVGYFHEGGDQLTVIYTALNPEDHPGSEVVVYDWRADRSSRYEGVVYESNEEAHRAKNRLIASYGEQNLSVRFTPDPITQPAAAR